MKDILYYILAAFFEIFGCYSFWLYFKASKGVFWLVLGTASLISFAYVLTRVESEFAGKAYAIYGGIYIFSSLIWLIFVEKQMPSRYDLLGASVSIFGALIILANIKN